jgi:hypothetical protein
VTLLRKEIPNKRKKKIQWRNQPHLFMDPKQISKEFFVIIRNSLHQLCKPSTMQPCNLMLIIAIKSQQSNEHKSTQRKGN